MDQHPIHGESRNDVVQLSLVRILFSLVVNSLSYFTIPKNKGK